MNWYDEPAEPAHAPPATPTALSPTARNGLRRGFATAAIAALLLVGGGVAAVSAASPDPSASAAPSATTNPSGGTDGNGGTTAPSVRPKGDCPDKGTSGNGSTDGSTDDPTDSGTSNSDA